MKSAPLLWLFLLASRGTCQQVQPLDSTAAETEYRIVVRSGRPPLIIRVEIGDGGKLGDTLVYHPGDSTPFQRLASCDPSLALDLNEQPTHRVLVEQADLNLDGYDDLKRLQFYDAHLDKSIFCVYLWDEKASRFGQQPQITLTNPIPHPENRTITSHSEFFGGTWSDSLYVWSAGKLLPIAEWGVTNEPSSTGANVACPWTAWCAKRISGQMRKVATKVTGCANTDPVPVKCTPPRRSSYEPRTLSK